MKLTLKWQNIQWFPIWFKWTHYYQSFHKISVWYHFPIKSFCKGSGVILYAYPLFFYHFLFPCLHYKGEVKKIKEEANWERPHRKKIRSFKSRSKENKSSRHVACLANNAFHFKIQLNCKRSHIIIFLN